MLAMFPLALPDYCRMLSYTREAPSSRCVDKDLGVPAARGGHAIVAEDEIRHASERFYAPLPDLLSRLQPPQ